MFFTSEMAFQSLLRNQYDVRSFSKLTPPSFEDQSSILDLCNKLVDDTYTQVALYEFSYHNGEGCVTCKNKKFTFDISPWFTYGNVSGLTLKWSLRGAQDLHMIRDDGLYRITVENKTLSTENNEILCIQEIIGLKEDYKRVIRKRVVLNEDYINHFINERVIINDEEFRYNLKVSFMKVRRSPRGLTEKYSLPLMY